MKVFITGASGFIGRATISELIKYGHTVVGLSRSESSDHTIGALGATPVRGDLETLEILTKNAAESDATVHLGFALDLANLERSLQIDRGAISAMADGVADSGKSLVISSGTLIVGSKAGEVSDETSAVASNLGAFTDRAKAEALVTDLGKEKGFRGIVVRFSPIIHGQGEKGMIPMMIGAMKQAGRSIFIEDGSQRWPACHVDDAASLIRLALESGTNGGIYHAVSEEGVPIRNWVDAASAKIGQKVEHVNVEEGSKVIGMLAGLIALDKACSSQKTKEALGWTPSGLGLIEDLNKNYHF